MVTRWESIKRAILVINDQSPKEIMAFRDAIKQVGLNINDCEILVVVVPKTKVETLKEFSSVSYFSKKDLGFLGKIKNDHLKEVLKRKYDLFLVIGDLPVKMEKKLKTIKATNCLGINTQFENLSINLTSNDTSPIHLLNFAKQILLKTI